jgi:hypothetical protein
MLERQHHADGRPLGLPCPIWDNDTFIGPRQPLPELAPCRHCGPRAVPPEVYCDDGSSHFRVICGGCGSSSGTRNARMGGDPVALVIQSWNRHYLGDLFYAHLDDCINLLASLDSDRLTPEQDRRASYLHDEALRLRIMVARSEVGLPSMQYRGPYPEND